MLYAISLLVVFLNLAALYESWSIPVSVPVSYTHLDVYKRQP